MEDWIHEASSHQLKTLTEIRGWLDAMHASLMKCCKRANIECEKCNLRYRVAIETIEPLLGVVRESTT